MSFKCEAPTQVLAIRELFNAAQKHDWEETEAADGVWW